MVAAVEVQQGRELFSLSPSHRVRPTVLDASARRRHLLLVLARGPIERRILFGHDERHLFWSILPGPERITRVDLAFEALKPREVREVETRSEAHRGGSRSRPVRQGEWFFVPEPDFVAVHWMRSRTSVLRRAGSGRDGHPHRADEMLAFVDESGKNRCYVRGAVRHSEHATIHLECWHGVHLNREEGKAGRVWVGLYVYD